MSKKKLIRDYIPDIDKYWDFDKNNGLTPDDIGASASQKVWTKCPSARIILLASDAMPGWSSG